MQLKSGVDAAPGNIKSGSPIIDGATVKQLITGGVDGAVYGVRCLAVTPDGTFLETGIIPVASDV